MIEKKKKKKARVASEQEDIACETPLQKKKEKEKEEGREKPQHVKNPFPSNINASEPGVDPSFRGGKLA